MWYDIKDSSHINEEVIIITALMSLHTFARLQLIAVLIQIVFDVKSDINILSKLSEKKQILTQKIVKTQHELV